MKKISLVGVCFFIALLEGFAHDANKAFFFITSRDSAIDIEAEFPWTLRDALIAFVPTLKYATTSEPFYKAFEQYIQSNLIIEDAEGNTLRLIDWQEIGAFHSMHQSTYLLRYEKGNIGTIRNTIMFNVFPTQTNFHRIAGRKDNDFLMTNAQQPSIVLIPQSDSSYMWWILLFTLLIISILILLRKKRIHKVTA